MAYVRWAKCIGRWLACSYFWNRLYAKVSIIRGTLTITFRIGVRSWNSRQESRWYAVPRRDNSRDSVSEQKMRLCRTHDRSRALFSLVPRLRFSEILREIAARNPMVISFLFAFAHRDSIFNWLKFWFYLWI